MRNWTSFIRERLAAEGESPDRFNDAIDELAAHLADVQRAAEATGANRDDAERAAAAELDGMGPLGHALTRRRKHAPAPPFWRGVGDDARQAMRALGRRRGFSAAVFLTLTLGIAVNTAAFSFVNALLIRDLPYRDPSRLAFMWTKLAWIGVPRAWVAGPHVPKLLHEASTIEDIAAVRTNTDHLTSGGAPELIRSGITSANLFDVLGVRPMLGRGFVKADEPQNVTILSHELWRTRFGADPAIVGKHIEVSGLQQEVIGVLPESFRFQVHSSLGDPLTADLWFPTDWRLATRNDGAFSFAAVVRAKPTATLAQVQSELDRIGAELDRTRYKSRGFGWQLTGVRDDLVRNSRSTLLLVATGAGFLLVVICANIAGLVLVRNAERRREFAVRTALGASRWQVARLVMIECVALSLLAGAAGAALAALIVRALVRTQALPLPRLAEVNVDWRVMAFTSLLALSAGLVFGVAPMLGTRGDLGALKTGGRGSSGRTPWLRGVLVAGELAIATLLIAGSTLLVRSYTAIRHVDPGFNGHGVLTARLTLDTSRYPNDAAAQAIHVRLAERLAAIPGVDAIGASSSPPLKGDTDQTQAHIVGTQAGAENKSITSDVIRSTPGYLQAMGIALIAGRDFTPADRAGAEPVAIVDETFARTAWPGGQAIGQRIALDDQPPALVVGVVRHARQYHVERDDREQVYRPYAQDAMQTVSFALRTSGDPTQLIAPLRKAVADVDAKQPLADVRVMDDVVSEALAARRLQLEVLGAFAAGAVLLAALGVYGILSSIVTARSREIGIRLAIGASVSRVRAFVLRDVLILTACGAAVGLVAALAGAQLIAHLLFSVSAHDPVSYAFTTLVLVIVAALAAYPPARRASRIDPAITLRAES